MDLTRAKALIQERLGLHFAAPARPIWSAS
jgi:hypothetical protein